MVYLLNNTPGVSYMTNSVRIAPKQHTFYQVTLGSILKACSRMVSNFFILCQLHIKYESCEIPNCNDVLLKATIVVYSHFLE